MPSLKQLVARLVARVAPRRAKARAELAYWRDCLRREGRLGNAHYHAFFTTHFGLSDADFAGLRVLDLGCGPRGSLEWAAMSARRVGLDPLAHAYRALGTARQAMSYVAAVSEHIPFPDASFDVVTSFNNLDHVDDLAQTVAEVKRTLAPGGLFLLLTEIGHAPTPTEPLSLDFAVVDVFAPELEAEQVRHFEMRPAGLYQSVDEGTPFDHADRTRRPAVVSARLRRTAHHHRQPRPSLPSHLPTST